MFDADSGVMVCLARLIRFWVASISHRSVWPLRVGDQDTFSIKERVVCLFDLSLPRTAKVFGISEALTVEAYYKHFITRRR